MYLQTEKCLLFYFQQWIFQCRRMSNQLEVEQGIKNKFLEFLKI